MSALQKTTLNNLLSKEYYFELCRQKHNLIAHAVDHNALGPMYVSFQKYGSRIRGFPLSELLTAENARMLEEWDDENIRSFYDEGVTELRLVVWTPERRKGAWFHTVRRLPINSPRAPLVNKAVLAHLIAIEYFSIGSEARHKPASTTEIYPEFQPQHLNLVSLRRITGNVYQAELCPEGTPRDRF
ncbi:hypothetical protein L227DRAFT_564050 [Lentinus tigrinus ALCF2SS1-6]|uniref:Uncharacterized protein n=1 Tax=Lentinus tigrinus ALCF2SS1-6 TaxID=1328759 RepID=A0A5C2S7K8_9APHY|nr:hypothetical protein L227DRAFT_564050 [Lentinus tigrinus ALCF2SS1-6]